MNDFLEQTVADTNSGKKEFLIKVYLVAAIIFAVLAVVFAPSVVTSTESGLSVNGLPLVEVLLLVVGAVGCFIKRGRVLVEYDYEFDGETLEVSAIYNRSKRKLCAKISMDMVERCGTYANNVSFGEVKCMNCYLYEDKLTYFVYRDGDKRGAVLLALNDEMRGAIKSSRKLQFGVWQRREGEAF